MPPSNPPPQATRSRHEKGPVAKQAIIIVDRVLRAGSRITSLLIERYRSLKESIHHKQLLLTEYPLVQVNDRPALQPSAEPWAIPGDVYQLWLNNRFGRQHANGIEQFRAINNSLSFQLFSHGDADAYMQQSWGDHPIHAIYTNGRLGPLKADIFRYCILWDHGGYYFDIDCSLDVPIRSLHRPGDQRLISYEATYCPILPKQNILHHFQHPERNLAMWGFGFSRRDPLLRTVIDNICDYYSFFRGKVFHHPKAAILTFTGPGMFTLSTRAFVEQHKALDGAQVGIEFNGHGCTWMPGSEVRFHQLPSYVSARNMAIA